MYGISLGAEKNSGAYVYCVHTCGVTGLPIIATATMLSRINWRDGRERENLKVRGRQRTTYIAEERQRERARWKGSGKLLHRCEF